MTALVLTYADVCWRMLTYAGKTPLIKLSSPKNTCEDYLGSIYKRNIYLSMCVCCVYVCVCVYKWDKTPLIKFSSKKTW
jgi:hypothetical protein